MKHVKITTDPGKALGPVKPVNGVNNGPLSVYDGQEFLFDASPIFREAEIPRVRLHDVEWPFGGELFVDYECIFPYFDADTDDPASYRFEETDRYLAAIAATGAKILYRLGVSIEHQRVKRFIGGPRDFGQFARICEHIVAHYAYGWKDGFHYPDILWEIWNEPNGQKDMWTQGNEKYAEMYAVTAKHLKSVYPRERVGGPTVSYITGELWPNCQLLLDAFGDMLKKDPSVPLDFFSWHNYACDPKDVVRCAGIAKKFCEDCGRPDAVLVMDEWNYVESWDDVKPSQETNRSQKGAAFVAANFIAMQSTGLQEASYYSAQIWPGYHNEYPDLTWNGIYHAVDGKLETLPSLRAFLAYRDMRRLGTQIETTVEGSGDVYAIAATNGADCGAYFVNFSAEPVEAEFRGESFLMEPWTIVARGWKLS